MVNLKIPQLNDMQNVPLFIKGFLKKKTPDLELYLPLTAKGQKCTSLSK